MDLSITKILLVLGAFGVLFLFVSEDETIAPKEEKDLQRVTRPTIDRNTEIRKYRPLSGELSRPPVNQPAYSNRFEQSSAADRQREMLFPEARFRPLDQNSGESSGYQSGTANVQPGYPAFSYGQPGHSYPNYRYQGGQIAPNPMLERFRPLDEKRQSKRWQGNFQRMTTWPEQLAAPNRPSILRLAGPD